MPDLRASNNGLLVLGILLACLSIVSGALGSTQEQRVLIGLRLFRTLLAADQDLESKVNASGQLALALVYRDDRKMAMAFAEALQESGRGREQGRIRQHPLQITLINAANIDQLRQSVPAAIYLVQPLPAAALAAVIQFGIEHQRIVFSPFEGDVKKGVLTGFVAEVRVVPHVNRTTLKQSGIRLNSLLLKVSKIED